MLGPTRAAFLVLARSLEGHPPPDDALVIRPAVCVRRLADHLSAVLSEVVQGIVQHHVVLTNRRAVVEREPSTLDVVSTVLPFLSLHHSPVSIRDVTYS